MIGRNLAGVQVWVAATPVDMRKSFDGLAEVVRSFLGRDPLSGDLFVFRNKGGCLAQAGVGQAPPDMNPIANSKRQAEPAYVHWR